ncbi:hypothetical protein [Labilibacter marinus]|uniref:hypothetical protein n=1 Tax=Labilibacter marinus TaxID=1477105 RepID=UPI000831DDC4|nr:hypothetical protein [Labilibacter marinus]
MDINKKNKAFQEQILRQTEKKFGRGKRHVWKNRDFEDLSHAIHIKTKVLISVATLKRLFGKVKTPDDYSPQQSTLDALINYTGYDPNTSKNKSSNKKLLVIILGVIVLMFTIAALTLYFVAKPFVNKSEQVTLKGKLSLIKTEGTCPTTAYFNLELPQTRDSIFVNFGDLSPLKTVNGLETISHFYAFPGQFVARLRTKNQALARSNKILVPTNGWQSFAYYFDKDNRERYYPIPMEKGIKDGVFHVEPRTIASIGIDTTQIVSVRVDNYQRTDINGDSFDYFARIKSSLFWPAIRCYSTFITIEGALGKVQFKFMTEGCSTYGSYILSEIKKSGSDSDLSNFIVGRNQWLDVRIKNEDKNVQVLVNDEEVFVGNYNKSIGDIIGTTIEFHGSGFVDKVKLSAGEECIFEGDF